MSIANATSTARASWRCSRSRRATPAARADGMRHRLARIDRKISAERTARLAERREDRRRKKRRPALLELSVSGDVAADPARRYLAAAVAFSVFLVFAAALAALGRLDAEPLREPLDAALGVDQLLTAGEERMAVVADFEVQLRLGRPGLPRRAARAARLDLVVLRDESLPSRQAPWGFRQKVIIPVSRPKVTTVRKLLV